MGDCSVQLGKCQIVRQDPHSSGDSRHPWVIIDETLWLCEGERTTFVERTTFAEI